MYGLSYSCMHTEGQLYATILFASFCTMKAVRDIQRDDCFKNKQWKVLGISSTQHTQAHQQRS